MVGHQMWWGQMSKSHKNSNLQIGEQGRRGEVGRMLHTWQRSSPSSCRDIHHGHRPTEFSKRRAANFIRCTLKSRMPKDNEWFDWINKSSRESTCYHGSVLRDVVSRAEYLWLRDILPSWSVCMPGAAIALPRPMSVLTQSTLYSLAISSRYLTAQTTQKGCYEGCIKSMSTPRGL